MQTNDRILQEQDAPDKNTDNAFVKVGSNGQPVMPDESNPEKATSDKPQPQSEPLK